MLSDTEDEREHGPSANQGAKQGCTCLLTRGLPFPVTPLTPLRTRTVHALPFLRISSDASYLLTGLSDFFPAFPWTMRDTLCDQLMSVPFL